MRILVFAALTLAGCSAGGDPPDPGCKDTDRRGTYLVAWLPLSGNCTSPDAQVFRGDPQGTLPSGCTADAADRWSSDGCSLERAYTCIRASDGARVSTVEAVTQDSDGLFSGATTLTLRDASGAQVCKGTFSVNYARQ